jgi:cation diffusion facilitator CzcD-associated flavoprotein CzcO
MPYSVHQGRGRCPRRRTLWRFSWATSVFQPDTLEYLNHVADKFDLRRDMQFSSTVTAAHWDDVADQWTVTLESGQQAKSRFLCTAIGTLSACTLPAIPRRDRFIGPAYHPARWPHTPVDFTGKRVGIIGTGATAIQAIPEIAKQAKQLTVFQRRPNWAAPLHNAKISKEEMARQLSESKRAPG